MRHPLGKKPAGQKQAQAVTIKSGIRDGNGQIDSIVFYLGNQVFGVFDMFQHLGNNNIIAVFMNQCTHGIDLLQWMMGEDYLVHLKKTEEDMKKEWTKDAEARAKTQLIINKIADEEKINPEKADLEKEIDHIMEHYPDADRNRTIGYVEMVMTNEKVLEFLESPTKKGKEKEEEKEVEK